MKLYDCTQAPNPRRVRIFMAEKGIDIPKIEIDIVGGENLEDDFLSKNPRGVIPTLELDDGSYIDESVAICRYLEELYPEKPLFGTDAKSKAIIDSRQRHMEFDGLLPAADIFRNSAPPFADRVIPGSSGITAIAELVPRGVERFQQFLTHLNDDLGKTEYIAGDQFSIADITAFCIIDFAKWVKMEIPKDHINTIRWYELIGKRGSFSA